MSDKWPTSAASVRPVRIQQQLNRERHQQVSPSGRWTQVWFKLPSSFLMRWISIIRKRRHCLQLFGFKSLCRTLIFYWILKGEFNIIYMGVFRVSFRVQAPEWIHSCCKSIKIRSKSKGIPKSPICPGYASDYLNFNVTFWNYNFKTAAWTSIGNEINLNLIYLCVLVLHKGLHTLACRGCNDQRETQLEFRIRLCI